MATATSTTPDNNATSSGLNSSKYTRILDRIRNLAGCRYSEDSKVLIPVRTMSNPSPPKKTAANRHPGQTHARTPVDEAISLELAKARYLMHDLADHVFGHIVSTELAKDILRQFINVNFIQVFHGDGDPNTPLSAESEDVENAIKQAFEDADRYDCIYRDATTSEKGQEPPTDAKGKGKQKTIYRFKWTTFPAEPLKEDELVSFMNTITDLAFDIAEPNLATEYTKRRHRLAAPKDKYRAVPLSYEPDGEDMRPDFLLLPIEAFTDDFKTVNQRYINFTAARMVGESKNKDAVAGIEQMQRYVRGLKRAQPWVHYVLGMTVTKDKAVFLRGEGSGTERLEIMLKNGRGCIEFIRILLGLSLADHVDLGHNPDVELQDREQACVIRNISRRSVGSQRLNKEYAHSVPAPLIRMAFSGAAAAMLKASQRPRTASGALGPELGPSSTLSKKRHLETDDSDEETYSKKRKADDDALEVNRVVFYPICVYGYMCVGILFTASSIRGRGTTVFCVVDLRDKDRLLALKIAWQDLGRVAEQDAVMERLMSNDPHPNVIVPIKTFKPERDGKAWTTLGGIRGFLDEQIEKLFVENRVLTVSVSELKRPVKYFWGVHDFVRGLRGALLGHEYLTKIGILHRDISENNILLGRQLGDERGYLIDLDMAILQEPEEPTPDIPMKPPVRNRRRAGPSTQYDDNKPRKGLRTGTFPYISYNVLWGGKHTQFDDVESFLYVLFLFFFSYAGPLSETELRLADENGFAQPIGSGRLSHFRNWPRKYAEWADGDVETTASQKHSAIVSYQGVTRIIESAEFVNCLDNHWPDKLHDPIRDLIESSFTIFWESTLRTVMKGSHTEVQHTGFIGTLDKWLEKYSDLEDEFSNCPFKQASS